MHFNTIHDVNSKSMAFTNGTCTTHTPPTNLKEIERKKVRESRTIVRRQSKNGWKINRQTMYLLNEMLNLYILSSGICIPYFSVVYLEWIALKQRRFISISKANISVACGWMPLAAGKHIPFELSAHCEFRVKVIVYSIEVRGQIKAPFSTRSSLACSKIEIAMQFCCYLCLHIGFGPLISTESYPWLTHTAHNPSHLYYSILPMRLTIVFSERFIYWLFGDKICHTRKKSTEHRNRIYGFCVYIIVCWMSMQSFTCAHINNKQHNTPQSTLAID